MNTAEWLLVGALFSLGPNLAMAEEVIRLTNGEWQPYHSEHLKYFGVGSRIVSEAFALAGIRVEYSFYPWARAKELAKVGKLDGCVSWAMVPLFKNDFVFSDTIYEGSIHFFYLKNNLPKFDWATLDDLRKYRIGVIDSFVYSPEFQQAKLEGKLNIESVPNELQNFRKMLANRIDLYPGNLDVGLDALNRELSPEDTAKFTYHPKPLRTTTYHLLLSKKLKNHEVILDRFNQGLAMLRKSGKYDEYLAESRTGAYLQKP